MQCLQCKGKVESDWVFCPNCGKGRPLLSPPLSDANIDEVYDAMMKNKADWDTPTNVVQFEKIEPLGLEIKGGGVRGQVFEVIVRQALAGAPWREICAGPLQVNNISPQEIQNEVERRKANLRSEKEKQASRRAADSNPQPPHSPRPKKPQVAKWFKQLLQPPSPSPPPGPQNSPSPVLTATHLIAKLRTDMIGLSVKLCEQEDLYTECSDIILTIDKLNREMLAAEMKILNSNSENILAQDLQRELGRVQRTIDSDGKQGPHHISS